MRSGGDPLARLLVRLYPRQVRDRDGEEMLETLRRRADAPRSFAGEIRFRSREWLGLAVGAVAEHRVALRDRSSASGRGARIPGRPRLRLALRSLLRSPSYTLPAIATLAVGLGAALALGSVVDHVILRPLPFPAAEDLVFLDHSAAGIGAESGLGFTPGLVHHLRLHARTLDGVAAFATDGATLADAGGPAERVRAAVVTPSFGSVLGVEPELGRWFTAEEAAAERRPVVLSRGLFERRYGGDPSVLGRTIEVDGEAREVIGIAPRGLRYPEPEVALWTPLRIDESTGFGGFWLRVLARRAPGADREAVVRELELLLPRIVDTFPADRPMLEEILEGARLAPLVLPLRDAVLGEAVELLWILLGAVALVLAIVGADLAHLATARADARSRDRAVREALGARRGDVLAESAVEAALVGGAGVAAGGAVAGVLLRLLHRFGPADLPRLAEVAFDGRTVALGAALWMILSGLLTVVPLRGGRTRLARALAAGRRGSTADRTAVRGREALIALQVALALVLTAGAGLLLRTSAELRRLDPGFDAVDRVATFRVALPADAGAGRDGAARFYSLLRERLAALPGVEAVGAVSCLPLEGWCGGDPLQVHGRPLDRGEIPPVVALRRAGPGALEALGVPLLAGRAFEDRDHEEGRPVVLVSETLARLYFAGEDPLGQRVRPPSGDGEQVAWHTVVGVVGDVPARELTQPAPMIYFPLAGPGFDNVTSRDLAVVVRGGSGARSAFAALVAELAPRAPVSHHRTGRDLVREALARLSFLTLLLTAAAGVAVLLAAIGLFGVVSTLVGRRRGELGIRLALGARRVQVRRLVLGEAVRVVLIGVAIGSVAAVLATRALGSLLVGVAPGDPATIAGAAAALLAAALMAADGPARRAARVDPAESLRAD